MIGIGILTVIVLVQLGKMNSGIKQIDAKLDSLTDTTLQVGEPQIQAAPQKQAAPQQRGAPTADMAALIDDDEAKGESNAPVTIVEFSDFECPFCARFYSQTLSEIDENYIKTGKVRFIYRNFPLSFHPNAQKAAEAAECAGEQGMFGEMHDGAIRKGSEGWS